MDIVQGFLAPYEGVIEWNAEDEQIIILDPRRLRQQAIERLVNTAVFGSDDDRRVARWVIWEIAAAMGVFPDTLYPVFAARVDGAIPLNFTIPAFNLRTMVFDMAQAVFAAALERSAGALVFELARSEFDYTAQSAAEYVAAVLGAAIKLGYVGPVYFQGDHFQVHLDAYRQDPEGEIATLQNMISTAMGAGFYSLDIGASALVNYDHEDHVKQFALNCEVTALLTDYIRSQQPDDVTVSVGAQVSPPWGRHSQEADVRVFLDGVRARLMGQPGLTKISVRAGTTYGGVVLPDGSVASVTVDFNALRKFSSLVRNEYGLGGVIQYGASTLPIRVLHKFVEAQVGVVHLATEFQNILFEHPVFPPDLRGEIYAYLSNELAERRGPGMTDAQFYYRERKRVLGRFKAELWALDTDIRAHLRATWANQIGLIFDQLNVAGTDALVQGCSGVGVQHRQLEDFAQL